MNNTKINFYKKPPRAALIGFCWNSVQKRAAQSAARSCCSSAPCLAAPCAARCTGGPPAISISCYYYYVVFFNHKWYADGPWMNHACTLCPVLVPHYELHRLCRGQAGDSKHDKILATFACPARHPYSPSGKADRTKSGPHLLIFCFFSLSSLLAPSQEEAQSSPAGSIG